MSKLIVKNLDQKLPPPTSREEIPVGSLYEYNSEVYMRSDERQDMCLNDGILESIENSELVLRVHGSMEWCYE